MAIPSRQIGWGTQENLLWQISKQLEQLTSVTSKVSGGGGLPYKVYTALLNQGADPNTDNPIPTVLENTLEYNVIWTREYFGVYQGALDGSSFVNNKTFFTATGNASMDGNGNVFFVAADIDSYEPGKIWMATYDSSSAPIDVWGAGSPIFVEIRVYP